MSTVDIRPFEDADAPEIARLSTAVQWPSSPITDSADALFAAFEHKRMAGFRIYPGA